MPLTLNGTTGIAGVDGSAGTPAAQGSDTNTGTFYPAADTISWATGGSERARITSTGLMLVNTTSALNNHTFYASNSGGVLSCRNTGAAAGKSHNFGSDENANFRVFNQGLVGAYLSDGGTSWTAFSSDARLKNKIGDVDGAMTALSKLEPLKYYFKNEPQEGTPRYGFFAQNVGEAIPDALMVAPVKNEEFGDVYTYNSEIINVYLVKAIQELSAKLDAAEARIAALEPK